MLVLTAKESDPIYLDGGRIVLTVVRISKHRVQLGFVAAKDIAIDRKEVHFDKLSRLKPKPE